MRPAGQSRAGAGSSSSSQAGGLPFFPVFFFFFLFFLFVCFFYPASCQSPSQAWVSVPEGAAAWKPLSEHPQLAGKRWSLRSVINICSGDGELEARQGLASGTIHLLLPYLASVVPRASSKESIAGDKPMC